MTPSGGTTPTGLQPVTAQVEPIRNRIPRWALPLAGVAVAAFVTVWALGSGAFGTTQPPGPEAAVTAEGDPARVLILPLVNRTGDAQAEIWGTLVAESATRLLDRAAPDLDVVASGAVRELVTELGGPAGASPRQAGRLAGATYVVSGGYSRLGGSMRFDVEIRDVATGDLLLALDPVSGPESEVDSTVALVAEVIAAGAAFRLPSMNISGGVGGFSPPKSLQTLELSSEAILTFCRQDYDGALALYERSIEREPTFLLPYIGALGSYMNGGRATLTRAELLLMVERYAGKMTATERDWLAFHTEPPEVALRAARGMMQVWPMAGYALALTAVRANHLDAALEGVAAIDFDDPCWGGWYPTWLMLVEVYHLVGDPAAELEAARRGRERFPAFARFILGEARAEMALGNVERAEALASEIEASPEAAPTVAYLLRVLGKELEVHGHAAAAQRLYARAWSWVEGRSGINVLARAAAAYRARPPREALPVLEEARDSFPANRNVAGMLAITLDRLGRPEEAEAVANGIYEFLSTSAWPALFYAQRGDAASAVDHLRRVFDAGRTYNNNGNLYLHRAPELIPIADDPAFRTLMRPKTGG